MLQQPGDPGGVGAVGLAPRHLLEVLGVDQQQFAAALQHVEDGLPVHAGRLHGRVGHALGGQPVGQRQQARGVAGEGADFRPRPPARGLVADAGHDGVLVDVQAGAVGVQGVHRRPPRRGPHRRAARLEQFPLRPSPRGEEQSWGRLAAPGQLGKRAHGTTKGRPQPVRGPPALSTAAARLAIFMIVGAARPHDAW